MNENKVLIGIEDAADVILNFIGTNEYEKILSSINNSSSPVESGFNAGLSIAVSLITAKCRKYTLENRTVLR